MPGAERGKLRRQTGAHRNRDHRYFNKSHAYSLAHFHNSHAPVWLHLLRKCLFFHVTENCD